jgi:ribosomal protein S24E
MTEKLIILNKKENPLFNRREIEVSIITEISPKIKEAEEFIAKEFSIIPENVKIKKIKGRFGSKNFIITANIYTSKEEKDKIETKTKTPRKKKGAKK